MLRKLLNLLVRPFGYEVRRPRPVTPLDATPGAEIYQYLDGDGRFDYDRYLAVQQAGNRQKLDHVWVIEENVAFLADYLREHVEGDVGFGICHGTRRGKEQEWFRKYLGCEVIGTEISDTASDFPHTIQWDFHEVKPEWVDAVDFIYSNSFDHSYDPAACLRAWMRCVRPGGLCLIEHTSGHERASELDPFGAHLWVLPYLVLEWGEGAFSVRDILEAPENPEGFTRTRFLVIQRN